MHVEREFVPEAVAGGDARRMLSYYVYEAPVRLWHWINALAITVLAVSGYLIGSPPPSLQGEASQHFLFGYIRFAHFAAAYIFAVGLAGRIYWACVGNHHSRQLFVFPFWDGKWWNEVLYELRWYLFIEPRPKRYIGHNPLAQLSMFFAFTLAAPFMIATGFALYGEGTGVGSWPDRVFGWVIPLFGGSQAVHSWHHLGMWAFVVFVTIHVYAAIREDIMSRQSIVSTMISGHRMFKD